MDMVRLMKKPDLSIFLDDISQGIFGRKRSDAIDAGICVVCGGEATKFKDLLSKKEYQQSAMCQTCQDKFFDPIE